MNTEHAQQLLMQDIDGSKIVRVFRDGLVETEDGRRWFWNDTSYIDDSTGHNWVADGEWKEYKR